MTEAAKTALLDVAIVMPVYNEAECIADVVASWLRVLSAQSLRFVLIVLNDGSKDATAEVLHRFANDSRVRVIDKQNSGHGPTILEPTCQTRSRPHLFFAGQVSGVEGYV